MTPSTPPALRPDYQLTGPMEDDAAPPASPFHIQRLLPFLLRFWWLPVLTLIISLGAAVGYAWWKPPTFVSEARMWETVKLRLPEGGVFSEDVQNFLGTQTELLKSARLNDLALGRLRSSSNNVAVPVGPDGEALPVVVRVVGSSRSSVFMIEATSSRAAYTQAYLNSLMNVYLEFKKNTRKEVSLDTLASITEQVQRMERDLKAEQDILTAFQRTNNLIVLEEEGKTAAGYLARLRTQLSDLQMENRFLQATSSNQSPALSAETNASPDVVVTTTTLGSSLAAGGLSGHQLASKEIELLRLQRAKLSRYLRPKHPKIVRLDADIERGEKLIEILRRQSGDQLAASRQTIRMRIENLLPSIEEWESKVVVANTLMAQGWQLKLNVQRVQSVYERLSMMVQNVGISRNIDQETLAILEPATPAERSYKQEIGLLAVAAVGGLGLGLGIIALIAFRDDRFTSLVEVTDKFGDSVVAQVPEVEQIQGRVPLALVENSDPRHMYAESYRNLRSAILYLATEGERPKTLLITSAMPNEGKSTIAANLARILALGGSRVVLVDCDLRKGSLHSLLGLQREPGLAELLRQPGDFEKIIQTNSLSNFAFIACGSQLSNPGDLFLSPAFDELLARLRQQFDYVVIDSSPVFAADDATTLAPKMDGTLFVVRSRFSGARPVREALELLAQRQAKVMGLIFNRADASQRSYYYYKHEDYHAPATAAANGSTDGNAQKEV